MSKAGYNDPGKFLKYLQKGMSLKVQPCIQSAESTISLQTQ